MLMVVPLYDACVLLCHVVLHIMLTVVVSHCVMLRIVLVVGVPTVRVGEMAGEAQDEELVGEGDVTDHIECEVSCKYWWGWQTHIVTAAMCQGHSRPLRRLLMGKCD